MATLLAKNADVVVTMDGQRRELKNAGLFAHDGVIEQVGPTAELPSTADRVLDLSANTLSGAVIGNGNLSRVQDILYHQDKLTITCARSESHSVLFVFRLEKMQLQKIGQFPSLADITIDEGKTYRTVLTREDSSEFHKAIGLAAHGVGIGSFVYLRRIFERLVISRFEEFKTVEGWADDDFPKRMAERVAFLHAHLPPFLVENSRIYSILSLGLHELDEKQCLRFFPVLKASIICILDEDKKRKRNCSCATP
jgi:hypothetical protein